MKENKKYKQRSENGGVEPNTKKNVSEANKNSSLRIQSTTPAEELAQ